MADIPARVPSAISARIAGATSQVVQRGGRAIDYAIGGVPFLSAATPQDRFIYETAQMQREQVDQEPEPGEQSLQGWWQRSQDSWHEGAGAKFQEGRGEAAPSARFYDSQNVDVWEPGELRLLPRVVQATATNTEATCVYLTPTNLVYGAGSSVYRTTIGTSPGSALYSASGETFRDIIAGRERWYGITDAGVVYTGPVSGGTTDNYPLANDDGDSPVAPQIAWAKHRLWAVYGRHVYTVNTSDVSGTEQESDYSHPSTDWVYTSIADGPGCVYLAGYSDAESCIQKVVLTEDGDLPVLTAGVTTAVLPPGERVQRIATLSGTVILVATNLGARLGFIDGNGDVQVGPRFLSPEGCVEATAATADGRFFYAAWRTSQAKARVFRIDTSIPFEDGGAPYARDLEVATPGYISDIAVYNGRVVSALAAGAYPVEAAAKYLYQHDSELSESGWVQMGYVRYRTTEPKIYKYIGIETEPLAGSIAVDAVLPGGSLNRTRVWDTQGTDQLEQAGLSSQLGPQASLGLRFTLSRSTTDATQGPVIHSYALKALPAVKPQRVIQLVLLCFDRESWSTGTEWGYKGFAADRLAALQALEDSGDLVLWQSYTSGEDVGRLVAIERVSYQEGSPPDHGGRSSTGGILIVHLRSMD